MAVMAGGDGDGGGNDDGDDGGGCGGDGHLWRRPASEAALRRAKAALQGEKRPFGRRHFSTRGAACAQPTRTPRNEIAIFFARSRTTHRDPTPDPRKFFSNSIATEPKPRDSTLFAAATHTHTHTGSQNIFAAGHSVGRSVGAVRFGSAKKLRNAMTKVAASKAAPREAAVTEAVMVAAMTTVVAVMMVPPTDD